jgi:hypothetical protein
VKKDGEKFTIDHAADDAYKDVALSDTIVIEMNGKHAYNTIVDISRDEYDLGHVVSYSQAQINFSPLINYIKQLEERIAVLEEQLKAS